MNRKILTAQDLRGILLASIEGVIEGKISVSQANAISNLATQFHTSIRESFEMVKYANEKIGMEKGKVEKLIGVTSDE